MTNEELLEAVGKWVAFLTPQLSQLEEYTWSGSDKEQYWDFLRRGAVKRQHEALIAVLEMTKAGHGYLGVTFLRPAYEELIWLEYLSKHQNLANEIVVLFTQNDVAESLNAQNEYAGLRAMAVLGFSQKNIKAFLARNKQHKNRLREIGKQLGWREGSLMPSMASLSRAVGREKDYKYLYYATSRFVHFSTHEILRRVWGKSGEVKIASNNFSKYWESFALYWGFRLFLESLAICKDLLPEVDAFSELVALLEEMSPVPIITDEELASWPDR